MSDNQDKCFGWTEEQDKSICDFATNHTNEKGFVAWEKNRVSLEKMFPGKTVTAVKKRYTTLRSVGKASQPIGSIVKIARALWENGGEDAIAGQAMLSLSQQKDEVLK